MTNQSMSFMLASVLVNTIIDYVMIMTIILIIFNMIITVICKCMNLTGLWN